SVLRHMAYTAAAAVILGWLWLVPAAGVWATLAAMVAKQTEAQCNVLIAPAPQIVTAQVAEAEAQAATTSLPAPGLSRRRPATGAIYTGDEYTAAHRSWPFGTWVRLRNPANGREVAVQITDRGPYAPRCLPSLCPHPTRSLDLSRAAAEALGITDQGVADLEARVLVWGEGR